MSTSDFSMCPGGPNAKLTKLMTGPYLLLLLFFSWRLDLIYLFCPYKQQKRELTRARSQKAYPSPAQAMNIGPCWTWLDNGLFLKLRGPSLIRAKSPNKISAGGLALFASHPREKVMNRRGMGQEEVGVGYLGYQLSTLFFIMTQGIPHQPSLYTFGFRPGVYPILRARTIPSGYIYGLH